MIHPFTKILESALTKSTDFENILLEEVQKIIKKGYPKKEICGVLKNMAKGRIDDREIEVIQEVLEEIGEEDKDE